MMTTASSLVGKLQGLPFRVWSDVACCGREVSPYLNVNATMIKATMIKAIIIIYSSLYLPSDILAILICGLRDYCLLNIVPPYYSTGRIYSHIGGKRFKT